MLRDRLRQDIPIRWILIIAVAIVVTFLYRAMLRGKGM